MRNSFGSLLAAATVAFGLSFGVPTSANAESVMKTCASQWKQAQAAGTTGGQSWPQFLAQCRTRQASSPSTPASAPAPAPQSGSLFPWSQPSAPASATASNAGGGQSVMKLCASQWKDAKAAGTTGGQSWPQFLAQCRTRQGSAAVVLGKFRAGAGACPGARARLPIWLSFPMVASRPLRRPHRARRLDSASGRIHDRTRSACAVPIGHRRVGQHADAHLPLHGNPLLRAHPATARTCARLTRAPPDIARRGTANVRPRPLLGKDVACAGLQGSRLLGEGFYICLDAERAAASLRLRRFDRPNRLRA